jgi:putative transposase
MTNIQIKTLPSMMAILKNDLGSCKINHPHYLKKAEKRLIRLQRKMSKKQKDSKNKEKARLKLADYHQYVSDARNDFLHKLSKTIIDENQVIVVEDLNTKGMVKNRHLAKSISDSGWSTFVTYLEYKAKWYGKKLIKVDRFYPSTKTCSNCGYINNNLTLSDREWTCPICGTYHDGDINASRNLYLVGLEQPDVKPVEIGSVDDRKVIALPKKHPIAEAEAGSHRFYKRG